MPAASGKSRNGTCPCRPGSANANVNANVNLAGWQPHATNALEIVPSDCPVRPSTIRARHNTAAATEQKSTEHRAHKETAASSRQVPSFGPKIYDAKHALADRLVTLLRRWALGWRTVRGMLGMKSLRNKARALRRARRLSPTYSQGGIPTYDANARAAWPGRGSLLRVQSTSITCYDVRNYDVRVRT